MGPTSQRIIVRTSGPRSREIASILTPVNQPGVNRARLSIDLLPEVDVTLLVFVAPRSATGEDVVEYHLPGNAYLATKLLERLFELGARQAQPGEFTARALFSGKIDLTKAEGVAAAIAATQRSELIASRQLLAGELSKRILPLIDDLAQTLALTEVGIDFTDEDVTLLDPEIARGRVLAIRSSLERLLVDSPRFAQVGLEPVVVLVGRPNAGKSTLLNKLAGYERAVVSPIAGTTRDAIEARVRLADGWVRIVDIAGLDQALQADRHDIDQQMREQADRAIQRADVVVMVRASDDDRPPPALPRVADVEFTTKLDLQTSKKLETEADLDLLCAKLNRLCFGRDVQTQKAQAVALNTRHRAEISGCIDALNHSLASMNLGAEFFAFDLREALDHLGRIVGTVSSDDVLGRVFSTFCIGK